jgi:hypothetical protein
MAIKAQQGDDWVAPVLVCDACGRPITDTTSALAVFQRKPEPDTPEPREPPLTKVYHCHESDPCQAATRARAGHLFGSGMCQGLRDHCG